MVIHHMTSTYACGVCVWWCIAIVEGKTGERMNSKRALLTGLANKIQAYLIKCYWKARKQGNFMNSEGVHEYDSHILF